MTADMVKSKTDNWVPILSRATSLITRGQHEEGLQVLDNAKDKFHKMLGFNYARAIAFTRLKRFSEALESARLELELNPTDEHVSKLVDQLEGISSAQKEKAVSDRQASAPVTISEQDDVLTQQLKERGWMSKCDIYRDHFDSFKVLKPAAFNPSISVVITADGRNGNLKQSLEALRLEREYNYEVILVNYSRGTSDYCDSDAPVNKLITLKSHVNSYLARNIGALFAEGLYLLFLNEDTIPFRNLLKYHLYAFEKYDIIACRGVLIPHPQNEFSRFAVGYFLGEDQFPHPMDVDVNTSYSSDIFFRIGGYDDEMSPGGGNPDLSLRLTSLEPDLRKQIYFPFAAVYEPFAQDRQELIREYYQREETREHLKIQHTYFLHFIRCFKKFDFRSDLLIRRKRDDDGNIRSIDPLKLIENSSGELASIMDADKLFTEIVNLDDEDYSGKRVLVIGSDYLPELKWANRTKRFVSVRPVSASDKHPSHVEVTDAPVEDLPFEDGLFEVVVLTDFSSSVKDIDKTVLELARVTADDGILIIAMKVNGESYFSDWLICDRFEKWFLMEHEDHRRCDLFGLHQSYVYNQSYSHAQCIEEGILIARMRRYTEASVSAVFAGGENKIGRIELNSVKMNVKSTLARGLSQLKHNPEEGLKSIKEAIALQYSVIA